MRYHYAWKLLCSASGILVPGGFGGRGTEGKITACKYARENNIPFLGVCLGLQLAVIEYARNVCGIATAHSEEFAAVAKKDAATDTKHDVKIEVVPDAKSHADDVAIVFMPEVSKD